MARTVFCRKYQNELPGLEQPPLPGAAGLDIYEHISSQAWQDWLKHQTMLINEKQLNMIDQSARQYLSEQRERFFSGEHYDQADGYVPEKQ